MNLFAEVNAILETANAAALELSDAIAQIDIRESNGNFQRLVAYHILQTGKKPEQITLGELKTIVTHANKSFKEFTQQLRQITAAN